MKIGISACLLGINCKYNGGNNRDEALLTYLKEQGYTWIPICPEVLGGLSIPRAPAEIQQDKVINTDGEDVTKSYIEGAQKALAILQEEKVEFVITQPRSPSCGAGMIYDGTFQKKKIAGDGIFVRYAKEQHLQVYTNVTFKKMHGITTTQSE